VTLAPGGMHLMMMGLKEPLKQGERVPLTLVFEKAGKIDVEMVVVPIGATPSVHEHK
jgi:copper(I)-binding protein